MLTASDGGDDDMADLRRITVEDVRAALAALPGYRLQAGVTFDPIGKRCCPEGAIAAARGLRSGEHGGRLDIRETVDFLMAELGLTMSYARAFAHGFDKAERWEMKGDPAAYELGYRDGRAIRAAFGVTGGIAS
jgi:hypothetical protein